MKQIFRVILALAVTASGLLCSCPLMAASMMGLLTADATAMTPLTSRCCDTPDERLPDQCPSTPVEDCTHCDVLPAIFQKSEAAPGPMFWLAPFPAPRAMRAPSGKLVKATGMVKCVRQTPFDLRVLMLN